MNFPESRLRVVTSTAMHSSLPLRRVMAPLVCCLTLTTFDSSHAAPLKNAAPPTPATVVEPAVPKRSLLSKLNPFQKKAVPPAPVPTPAPLKNSKKSGFFSRLKAKLNQDPDAALVGEKPARPSDWKERWIVTDESTAFFEFGPSQANGPDLRLPRGQVIKLTQSNRGWVKVELEGGRQGYIGTDQMRQASEDDFTAPLLPANTQLAAVGSGAALQGWSPIAPPPDLPDLPMAAGMEDSLLLLPPLEYEGAELKKSSLKLKPLPSAMPLLQPGDPLPPETLPAAPEPPVLDREVDRASPLTLIPAPSEPAPLPPTAEPIPAPLPPILMANPTPASPTPVGPPPK